MFEDELDELLRQAGVLIPAEGAKNPPPIEKKANGNQDLEKVLRPPSEKLTVQDMTELIQILNLAVKAHSSNYQPSPAMIEAFFSRVMEGFSAYGDAPAAPDGLPSVREVYEYAEDPGDVRAPEIPPRIQSYELVLQINVMTSEMRFFARSNGDEDGAGEELPVLWTTFGGDRLARLQAAVLSDMLAAWEEHNAERAIQHARRYIHLRWASLERGAHRGLLYDFVPVQAIFMHMPQFMIGHQDRAPRFWFTDAERIERK